MKAMSQDLQLKLRSNLQVQLMKLPRAIRTMPIEDFVEKYQSDINQVSKRNVKKRTHDREAKTPIAARTKTILDDIGAMLNNLGADGADKRGGRGAASSESEGPDVAVKLESLKSQLQGILDGL